MAPSDSTSGSFPFAVHDLAVGFRTPNGVVPVVAGVDLDACPGRILGIAGESGSGKTTAVLAAIGFLPAAAVRLGGRATLDGASLFDLDPAARRRLWASRISYVAQDAAASLNPAFRIGTQLSEVLRVGGGLSGPAARERSRELLAAVRLPDPDAMLRRFPHQCSGGQLQRVAIAIAIASNPKVIVLDEPTTGLDVTTQAEVVGMLTELIRARGMAAIYISHDLALLGSVADDLIVFYAGEVVERGPTPDVLRAPRHPYTRGLLDALPSTRRAARPAGLPGLPPGHVVRRACPFAPRCRWSVDACRSEHPALTALDRPDHLARCLRSGELAARLAVAEGGRAEPRGAPRDRPRPVLTLHGLTCSYGRGAARVKAVDDATLEVGAAEVVAIVGESGSGKSTIGKAIVGLVPIDRGGICFDGIPLDRSGRRTAAQRRAIQIIFQNPDSSLNPRHTVGALIGRSLELFRPEVGRRERRDAVAAALVEVRLDPSMIDRYPHQLSGGQKQRVAIARAFVARPRLVVCDEIVSGQDVSVQAAILELVRSMQERHGTALLFVSHDLAVVRSIAQRVFVIRRGRIVESGATEHVFERPRAPYTRALLDAVLEPPALVGS